MSSQTFNIDVKVEEKLGRYVYTLTDPRDNKVFYVGQGKKNALVIILRKQTVR